MELGRDVSNGYEEIEKNLVNWRLVIWWHYLQGNRLANHRSRVRVLAGHGLEQATYTCVPLSPNSIVWYWPRGWSLWLGK